MKFVAQIRKACPPARLYLYVSLFSIALLVIQNVGNCGVFSAGSHECDAPSLLAIFVGQGLYVAFWTLVLQGLCQMGYESLSWFIFLFPLLMFFVLMGVGMISAGPPRNKKSPIGYNGMQ